MWDRCVMGFIDAFRSIENPGNVWDCMKGRIRFMTAITSAYAPAYQVTCLPRHMPAVPRRNFRLPKPKARSPHLPNVRITTRERGKDGPSFLTGVLALVKPYLDGVLSLDFPMKD